MEVRMVTITRADCDMVYAILQARWPMPDGALRDELISAGFLGLARAADRYQPNNATGATFNTFASQLVVFAMQDALRSSDHLSRGDRHAVNAQRKERALNREDPYDAPFTREDGTLIPDAPLSLDRARAARLRRVRACRGH